MVSGHQRMMRIVSTRPSRPTCTMYHSRYPRCWRPSEQFGVLLVGVRSEVRDGPQMAKMARSASGRGRHEPGRKKQHHAPMARSSPWSSLNSVARSIRAGRGAGGRRQAWHRPRQIRGRLLAELRQLRAARRRLFSFRSTRPKFATRWSKVAADRRRCVARRSNKPASWRADLAETSKCSSGAEGGRRRPPPNPSSVSPPSCVKFGAVLGIATIAAGGLDAFLTAIACWGCSATPAPDGAVGANKGSRSASSRLDVLAQLGSAPISARESRPTPGARVTTSTSARQVSGTTLTQRPPLTTPR